MYKHSDKVSEIKSALHITKPNSFSKYNTTVSERLTDRNLNTAYVFSDLLTQGIQILINIGQFDMKDGVIQTLEWTKQIELERRDKFDSQARNLHKYIDGDGIEKIGGYFRHASNFTLIVTPKAGHMVPAS